MATDTRTTLSKIRQIALPVRDIAEANCGGVQLMLAGPEGQGKDGEQQHGVLFYDVSDIKATHARIKSSGAKSLEEPRVIARMNGREIWVSSMSDGQGNVVGLMSDTPEA